jgi:replicative DNA helicase
MRIYKASELLDRVRSRRTQRLVGLQCGIDDLDCVSRGLPVGLVVLAGRPQSGHGVLARQIALNVVQSTRSTVAWFSTQLSAEAFVEGLLQHSLAEQVLVDNNQLTIIDSPRLTVSMTKSSVKTLFENTGCTQGLVVIDALEMAFPLSVGKPRVQRALAKKLRSIALANNISLIVCCGLSRKLEERKDKVPRISDLKNRWNFDMEADLVIATHYPYTYEPDTYSTDEWSLRVLKNRHGPVGGVGMSRTELPWPKFMRFTK